MLARDGRGGAWREAVTIFDGARDDWSADLARREAECCGDATVSWPLRYHYYCRACNWTAPQSDFAEEPKTCPRCGAMPDGSTPWPDGIYRSPKDGWTCFHCGETFWSEARARDHFGANPLSDSACRIKAGQELGLVVALRDAEARLARYEAEDSDKDREIGRLISDHATALRREEEQGYERGLRDARARSIRIAAEVKAGLRNGGARNACDDIAAKIGDPNHD
jgi:hypothetical protein